MSKSIQKKKARDCHGRWPGCGRSLWVCVCVYRHHHRHRMALLLSLNVPSCTTGDSIPILIFIRTFEFV